MWYRIYSWLLHVITVKQKLQIAVNDITVLIVIKFIRVFFQKFIHSWLKICSSKSGYSGAFTKKIQWHRMEFVPGEGSPSWRTPWPGITTNWSLHTLRHFVWHLTFLFNFTKKKKLSKETLLFIFNCFWVFWVNIFIHNSLLQVMS